MSINIDAALKVSGWMTPEELSWLAEQASQHTRIVEIGSWEGRSTRALADHTPGTVWAVDHFQGTPDDANEPLNAHLAVVGSAAVKEAFCANLADHLTSGRVVLLEGSSVVVARECFLAHGPSCDMIFLDGGHNYLSVRADVEAWLPLLAPGGLFCGHDGYHRDVAAAIRDTLPRYEIVAGQIWRMTDAT